MQMWVYLMLMFVHMKPQTILVTPEPQVLTLLSRMKLQINMWLKKESNLLLMEFTYFSSVVEYRTF